MIAITLAGACVRTAPLVVNRFHPDEALFATLARLIASGNDPWLRNSTLLVDKPPLFYYTLAAGVTVAGGREIALRLPDLWASIISMALVARIAWLLWRSHLAATTALIVSAFSPFAILFSPTAFSDPQFVMWILAALAAVCAGRWVWGGILMGLAIACKQSALLFLPLALCLGCVQMLLARATVKVSALSVMRFAVGLGAVLLAVIAWDRSRAPASSFWMAGIETNNPGRLIRSTEVWPRASAWLSWMQYFGGSTVTDGVLAIVFVVGMVMEGLWGRRIRGAASALTLSAYILAYFALLWFVAFPLLDRYLLPVVYLVALVTGRGIHLLVQFMTRSSIRLQSVRNRAAAAMLVGLVVAYAEPAWQAARSAYPVGGDHGAFDGIDHIAEYLKHRPTGSVVYSHDLGWLLDYYLFDAYLYPAYFQGPGPLEDDLRAFGHSGVERYLVLSRLESSSEIEDAIRPAGYRLVLVEIAINRVGEPGIRLYRIQAVL